MKHLIWLSLLISGCDEVQGPKFLCKDGIVYVMERGAWIQAMLYKDNKCLPIKAASKSESKETK